MSEIHEPKYVSGPVDNALLSIYYGLRFLFEANEATIDTYEFYYPTRSETESVSQGLAELTLYVYRVQQQYEKLLIAQRKENKDD